ncbi:amidase [Noviherbaspirillum pedocola]|uniref:Amidase n=1 Tax=Noviherbaspirillum pedocola TaxID=2801341 RepID=A0A934T1B5_9BURK|nr:amidase [Noviherbaspirillum pedocola]MBK4737132.1 amidase [Noviherbaspirillum pedocola]
MIPSLPELQSELAAGKTSSAQLTEAALTHIADPAGEGARVYTRVYADTARVEAQASDLLRGAGLARSAIDGLPISIKDLFDIAGETTLAGSVALQKAPAATADAAIVRRLRAAGAVIIGRTNMTEFAFSGLGLNPHYGTPKNPWDRATGRIPGGSSSGAAVSVTDGMAAAAIGTDTGGSVRIPAAFCGLTGFKPTARRISTQGALPLSTTLDSIGPIAPTVACCALIDAILSGEEAPLPTPARLRGLRLAVPQTVTLDGMDAAVSRAFDAALARLSAGGAMVESIALPEFSELAGLHAGGGFSPVEAWAWHKELVERAGERYDPRVLSRMRRGERMSAAELIALMAARRRWIAAVEARIAGFDAMLLPTVPIVAPTLAELEDDEHYFRTNALVLRNPSIINFLDGCALSLPCQARGEAPVGLTLAAPGGRDRAVLAMGMALEACLQQD